MSSKNKYGDNFPYLVFMGLAFISIIMGFIFTPSLKEIGNGLLNIIKHHHMIDSELIIVSGNFGSAFVNAGLILLSMLLVYKLTKTKISGPEIAAIGQIFGYAFYAESLFNIWPLVIGVLIEGKVNKRDLSKVSYIAWFSTALAPFVSTLAMHTPVLGPGTPFAFTFAIVTGLVAGYLVGKFAGYIKTLHKGRLLFNIGFTTGVVGFFSYSVLKAWGLGHDPYTTGVYIEGMNAKIFGIFMIFNIYLLITGLIYNGGFGDYFKTLFKTKTYGGDYVEMFGMGNSLINVGIVGTAALAYTLITPFGQLNGPVLGGVYTVAGFAASGMTLLSVLPIWIGIYFGSFLMGGIQGLLVGESFLASGMAKTSSRAMLVGAMHCCGMSPVAKRDGWKAATVAAMMHTVIVPNIGVLHGWMSSYNNGFSQGLILTLMYPIWHFFSKEVPEEQNA